jgi:hypothetical protein
MMSHLKILLFLTSVSLLGCSAGERSPTFQEEAPRSAAVDREQAMVVQAKKEENTRKPAGNGQPAGGADKPTPRKIIYTGTLDLIVDDFEGAEQQLRQLVEEHEGYLADYNIHNQPGSPRSGVWTVRVPSKHFDAFMQSAAKFGEVRNRTTNSQDITDAYHDKAAHLKADEAEEKSLLALLEKTQGKVEDILRVREQLRIVRGQIEQEKSQLQRWDKDVDLATVTVKLLDRRDYQPPILPDFGSTVGRTFQGSIDALVLFGKAIILTVVALAPWLVVLGLLVTPGFILWRRRRAASAPVSTATPVNANEESPPQGNDDRPEGAER